jgi:hypothetical protein
VERIVADTTKQSLPGWRFMWGVEVGVGVFFENSIVCRWIVSAIFGAASVTVTKPSCVGVWLVMVVVPALVRCLFLIPSQVLSPVVVSVFVWLGL